MKLFILGNDWLFSSPDDGLFVLGTLADAKAAALSCNISAPEFDYAVYQLNLNAHNIAVFGIEGTFIYSQEQCNSDSIAA